MTIQDSEPARPGRLLRDGIPVAVVGYIPPAGRSGAAGSARDGIPVAVVGYIGGDYLQDDPATRPPGAGRVVNIRGDGYLLTGRNLFFNGTEFAVLYSALAAEDGSETGQVARSPHRHRHSLPNRIPADRAVTRPRATGSGRKFSCAPFGRMPIASTRGERE